MWRLLERSFDNTAGRILMASPWGGLLLTGAVCGVLAWLVQRVMADPATRRLVGQRRACFMELWLYRHDPFLGLRLCRESIAISVRITGASWKPVCLLVPLFAFAWVELDAWLAHRPFGAGEKIVLTVLTASAPQGSLPEAGLSVSDNLAIETSPVRVPGKGEQCWRIGVLSTGPAWADIQAGDERVRLGIVLGNPPRRIPPLEPNPPGTRLTASVTYPACRLALGPWAIRWEWAFLSITCLMYGLCGASIGRILKRQVET